MDISKDKFKSEIKRWRQKWSGKNANVTPKTFVETIDHDNRERSLRSIAILHIHKHKDIDDVITEFACLKGRRLGLCLRLVYL